MNDSPPKPRRPGGWADSYFAAAPAGRLRGWRRPLSRLLGAIGPTWRAAPIRRINQTATLALFLWLFIAVAWPYSDAFGSRVIADKRFMPLEAFLWIDPLVGLSTAIADRAWNIALAGMLIIGAICLVFPRGFCGYLCPLGTLIDAFDFAIGRPIRRLFGIGAGSRRAARLAVVHGDGHAPPRRPWWVALKYYLLAAVLVGSVGGIILSGFVAAIPVVTRGLVLSVGQVQIGLGKHWGLVSPMGLAAWCSLALFASVFLLGLMRPRFWCRYVCPSGALFSCFNFFRASQRKVTSACTSCNRCVEICPFDAIHPDYTTRALDCTFCQTCGGACPTRAIIFTTRGDEPDLKPPAAEVPSAAMSRRGIVLSILGGAVSALAIHRGTSAAAPPARRPLRPPGSVPEDQFLDLCIRCGECLKVCPGPVLQFDGAGRGLESLWTPAAVVSHAACHPECIFCTEVCPTRAIVPLSVTQKRKTPMGLAILDTSTCLPHAGKRDCRLCYEECEAAGYHAIEMRKIKLAVGEIPQGVVSEEEKEQMGQILAPFVLADRCVGCGLCEYRCSAALVHQRKELKSPAVILIAEDRRQPRLIRPA